MELPFFGLLKKVTSITIGNVFGQLIGLLFLTVLARMITKAEYGEVRYVISVAGLAGTVIAAGLPTTLTRFLAKHYSNKEKMTLYFSNILVIFFITLFVTEIVVIILFWPDPIYALVVLGYSVPHIYNGVVRGRMQYYKLSVVLVAQNIVRLLLLLAVFFIIGADTFSVLLIYAFTSWITLSGLELFQPSLLPFRPKVVSKEMLKETMRFSVPVFVTTVTCTILSMSPIVVLERYWDYETVAVYSVAFLVTIAFGFIPMAITTITMPKMASLRTKAQKMRAFNLSVIVIIVTGVLMFLGAAVLGKWGIVLIFSSRYSSAYVPMLILAAGSVLGGIRNAFSALWEGNGIPQYSMYDTILGAVVCVITAFILIPRYGGIGGAFAFTLGWSVSVIASGAFLVLFVLGRIRAK